MRLATVLLLLAAFVLVTTATRPAMAAGSLRVMTPDIQESGGQWHVRVRIDLPKPPNMLHIPMRFKFVKQMVYERAVMEKGKDPVLNKMSINPPTQQIVQLIVDFADASGKVHAATLYEFDLKREAGFFEAGEYQVSVIGPDGDVGTPQKVILKGDNPVVYRGAISFDGPKNKIQDVSSGIDAGPKEKNDTPAAVPTATDVAAVGSGSSMIPQEAFNKTSEEEIKERPKGCGCALPGGVETSLGAIGLTAAALGLVAARRRRRAA